MSLGACSTTLSSDSTLLLMITVDGVRVRFAPSPTGHLHLGGLRTALYNFLFARHHKGSFVLRIEDTDRARLVPESVGSIERLLHHYGLHYDEGPSSGGSYGPYQQSERLPFYRDAVHQLLDTGHAYRCFCSDHRLALLRKDAVRRNEIPTYDRRCRSLSDEESQSRARSGEPYVVRFKLDKQNVSFEVRYSLCSTCSQLGHQQEPVVAFMPLRFKLKTCCSKKFDR
ncbi:unnamed protein product [Heligmosomoides polygyrus]|uniref:tRNA-synt_1c domain-containing protein n=1 Tax=Heligmosomoides polygyrus TaxID=6339 RepID=A0A183GU84_HELPZ|nr:unnamed protein product [Heligmosomoides polygyrus]